MNRMIWIWRLIAILILLIFAILMWNLYARLVEVKEQRGVGKPAVGAEVSLSVSVLGSRFSGLE